MIIHTVFQIGFTKISKAVAANQPCCLPAGSSVKRGCESGEVCSWEMGWRWRVLPWELVPPAQPKGPTEWPNPSRAVTLCFYLSVYCNPSVIPPVFKDTILIVLNSHSTPPPKKRIRLPLTQQVSVPAP